MESAPTKLTAEQNANLVAQRLRRGGGIPELATASLLTIQEQTIKEVDRAIKTS